MFSIIYVSSAVRLWTQIELLDLLAWSREHNADLGVTGMLLYKGGNFLQILEGEEEPTRGLYDRIGRDPRHHGIIVLLQGTTRSRHFADWSMGFGDLDDPATVRDVPGYSDFLNTPLTAAEFGPDPGRAERFLLMFKRNMA